MKRITIVLILLLYAVAFSKLMKKTNQDRYSLGGLRAKQKNLVPKLMLPIDNTSFWSYDAGRCTLEYDTTHYLVSVGTGSNFRSITINPTGSHEFPQMDNDFGEGNEIDVNNCILFWTYYIHEGSGITSYEEIDGVNLYLFDSSSNYRIFQFAVQTAIHGFGWRQASFHVEDYKYDSSFDVTDLRKVRFMMDLSGTGVEPRITFDSLAIYPQHPKAYIILRQDDGVIGTYSAFSYMAYRGLHGVVGVIGNKVGDTGYMTAEQLRWLQDMGHLVVCHGWDSPDTHWDQFSDAEILNQVKHMYQWMNDNGLIEGSRIWIIPGGDWKTSLADTLREYIDFVFLTAGEHISDDEPKMGHTLCYPFFLQARNATSVASSTINNEIDDCISKGTIYSVYWHGDNGTNFQGIIDHVAEKKEAGLLEVITPLDIVLGNFTLDNPYEYPKLVTHRAELDNGDSGTGITVNWTSGNNQKVNLTGNCTFTFSPEPKGICNLSLRLIQDSTGSRTVTWPGDILWPDGTAPTLTTDGNAVDIVKFYYDGNDFYGAYDVNYAIP